MEARRRWATAVVVLVALAAGGGGVAYFWTELAMGTDGDGDGGLVRDASADARAGRKKPKSAKRKGGRRGIGKPRPLPKPVAERRGDVSGGDDDQGDDNGDDTADDFQPPFRGRGPAGPTYEAAIGSNHQEIDMGGKAQPDLTDAQLSGPMRSGAFVSECGAPDAMKVTVKVAIKMGRPAGVSVSTSPPDPDIAGCIDRYVRTFTWPSNGKMDSFITTY